jgi:hypothetical protein
MEALPIVKYRQRRTGGVISPLLANLSLHFTLDVWLSKHYPQVNFVRYADDVVVHCTSEPGVVLSLENGILLKRIKNNTSRMTGDCHVWFCERLGGETPPCLLGDFAVNYY